MFFLPHLFFDEILKDGDKPVTAERLSKMSVLFSVITSLILVILKLFAWLATNSFTIRASLVDSGMDTVTSLFAFAALWYSFKREDENHGYGHGKIEGIVSLVQVVFMTILCCDLVKDAFDSINSPEPRAIESPLVGISVMFVSSLLVYFLVSFQMYSAKKTQSTVVASDSLHYSSDLFMNIGVMFSFFLSNFIPFLDIISCFGVCIYVIVGIIRIFITAMQDLMDVELPKKDKVRIIEVVNANCHVLKILHMKTRRSGTKKIVQIDVELDNAISFVDAYKIAKEVENSIAALFFHSEIVVIIVPSKTNAAQ